ncbi:hypothetical protein ACS0TY_012027 [Phlomoides rotata]
MWFRDPFPRFYLDGDFQIGCDEYLFNNTDLNNTANGGFIYVKSNDRTIQFYKYWYTGKYYFPKDHDQGLFNIIKYNPFVKQIGLEIRFLDTDYFGGFCQPSRDLDLVATMHANCCVNLWNKNNQIPVVIRDWKKYISSPRNSTNKSCPWSIPRLCDNIRDHSRTEGFEYINLINS